jgi:hypothetical protein
MHGLGLITRKTLMVNEWEAQNILTSSTSKVILGLLTMDSDHWYLIHKTWVGKAHFLHGLGLITHKASMVV